MWHNIVKTKSLVTPFVGVWIETFEHPMAIITVCVTPFVGVWIETGAPPLSVRPSKSHPSWVCGLKRGQSVRDSAPSLVTPFVGVWIETDSDDN